MLNITPANQLLLDLGIRIRTLRLLKGLSLTTLAYDCDMEKSTLSRIENGKVNITYITQWRLSLGLSVSMNELNK